MVEISKIVFLGIILLFSFSVRAQEKKNADAKLEMKIGYLVLLKKGESRSQGSAAVNSLQKQHMAHLTIIYEGG